MKSHAGRRRQVYVPGSRCIHLEQSLFIPFPLVRTLQPATPLPNLTRKVYRRVVVFWRVTFVREERKPVQLSLREDVDSYRIVEP